MQNKYDSLRLACNWKNCLVGKGSFRTIKKKKRKFHQHFTNPSYYIISYYTINSFLILPFIYKNILILNNIINFFTFTYYYLHVQAENLTKLAVRKYVRICACWNLLFLLAYCFLSISRKNMDVTSNNYVGYIYIEKQRTNWKMAWKLY